MAETDFISRKAIYDAVNDIGGCDASDEYAKGWDKAIDAVISIIEELSAVDVVPVVRCMDCVAYDDDIIGWCNRCGSMQAPDDFCSYGKRKELDNG